MTDNQTILDMLESIMVIRLNGKRVKLSINFNQKRIIGFGRDI